MGKINLAVLPGDGIGKEVVPASLKVLDVLADIHGGIEFEKKIYPWNCDYYMEHGKMMPDNGYDQLRNHDAIFLGAIGDPKRVPDHIALWGALINIRREFQQVINLRPVKSLRGIQSPLRSDVPFDFIVVRENSEGEYSQVGGLIHQDEDEIAIQTNVFTRKATEHVINYAFELAKMRGNKLTSATKSNGLFYSMPFWNKVFNEVTLKHQNMETELIHIDALSAYFVTKPESFDVIVASNLFGDILTDIGAAIMGSIGIAPSANINVNGKYPSMFEPVHGSAPDIAGRNIANPIGQLWTTKLMLDHFGHTEIATMLLNTMEDLLVDGIKTPDLGGKYGTTDFTEELIKRLKQK